MRIAIVSDIHGNLEALERVSADIAGQGCDRIICLGDTVGYGPNPRECVDLVSKMDACILGNHDYGALIDPEGFSATAEQAIFWTRRELEGGPDPEHTRKRLAFLAALPRVLRDDKLCFVHGSIRNPLNEYVFPEDIYNQRKMERIFSLVEKDCFQGHTHIPGVFTEDLNFLTPEELNFEYQLGTQKHLVNVGSVGQPRNGVPESSYVILDADKITFRRVKYDVEKTANKIYAIPELDRFLGDRLKEGR